MAGLGATEILIILAVVLLLFGSTRLPQLARSLGKSARILRTETQGLHDDEPDAPAPSADPHHESSRPQAALPPGRPTRGAHRQTRETRSAR